MRKIVLREVSRPVRILSESRKVRSTPRLGRISMDQSCPSRLVDQLRPHQIQVDLERICLWEAGEVTFRANGNVVSNAEGVILDNSLIFSLHPERSDEVFEKALRQIDSHESDVPIRKVDGQNYIACNEGSGTWGHWLVHNVPRIMLFLEAYPDGRVVVPKSYFGTGIHGTCGQLLEVLGYHRDRFVLVSPDQVLRLEHVVLIDLPYRKGIAHPLAIELLQNIGEKVRSSVHGASKESVTFVQRLGDDRRDIANRRQLFEVLKAKGVSIYRCSLSLESQVDVWCNSRAMTGVLGSDFANMVFGGAERLLVITPAWFGDNFFFGLASQLGKEWNEVFCGQMMEKREPIHASSFVLDIDLYGAELDRMKQ